MVVDFRAELRHNGYMMKIGSLYRLKYPLSAHLTGDARKRWQKPALYLGEDPIHRSDGVTVVNHKFLVGGKVLLADRTFLTSLREIENEN